MGYDGHASTKNAMDSGRHRDATQSGRKPGQAGGPSPMRAEFYVPAISHLTVFASREGRIIAAVLVAGAQAEHWLTHGLFQGDMPTVSARDRFGRLIAAVGLIAMEAGQLE